LGHINALDFVHIHFDRSARDEAGFQDRPAIRDHNFGRLLPHRGVDEQNDAYEYAEYDDQGPQTRFLPRR
jgi:hypothetical protein